MRSASFFSGMVFALDFLEFLRIIAQNRESRKIGERVKIIMSWAVEVFSMP